MRYFGKSARVRRGASWSATTAAARWPRAIPPMRVPLLQADAAATVAAPVMIPAANIAARQVLRDGEIVILYAKPSIWYIVLSSLLWTAAVLIAAITSRLADPHHTHLYIEAALFAVSARVMWSILNWMGRLYVLTDQRVLRVAGVFNVDIFECPLRKVARTRLVSTFRERLLRVGSIEIIPEDESRPCALWQTIAHPLEVQEKIQHAVRRAKQGGGCLL
jgi:hypothetical protein